MICKSLGKDNQRRPIVTVAVREKQSWSRTQKKIRAKALFVTYIKLNLKKDEVFEMYTAKLKCNNSQNIFLAIY